MKSSPFAAFSPLASALFLITSGCGAELDGGGATDRSFEASAPSGSAGACDGQAGNHKVDFPSNIVIGRSATFSYRDLPPLGAGETEVAAENFMLFLNNGVTYKDPSTKNFRSFDLPVPSNSTPGLVTFRLTRMVRIETQLTYRLLTLQFCGSFNLVTLPPIQDIAVVNAASYKPSFGGSAGIAPSTIAAAFGQNLAPLTVSASTNPLPQELAGVTVEVQPNTRLTGVRAGLFFVSPGQVNFLMPELGIGANQIPVGVAYVRIYNAGVEIGNQTVNVVKAAPGLLTADGSGAHRAVANALALRVRADGSQAFEPISHVDQAGKVVADPIDLGPEGEKVYLVLYGTGWRHETDLGRNFLLYVDSDSRNAIRPEGGGAQGQFAGLDQLNLLLPRTLGGRGTLYPALDVAGRASNQVQINIK